VSTQDEFKPGDRVYVTDPGLAELRAIMRSFGEVAKPNHVGTVDEIDEDHIEIWFDNEDGPGMGQGAPYPFNEVRHLTDKGPMP